jgi:hypothetical protein
MAALSQVSGQGAGSRRRKVGIELTRALVFQGRIHPDKKKV